MKEVKSFEFRGVTFILEPRIVRISGDEKLSVFLQEKLKAARSLSDRILAAYRAEYGNELKIGRESLAIEIYMHYVVRQISRKLEKHFRKNRLIQLALQRTEIIDCGEKTKDNNRFIWDCMTFFTAWPRRISHRR